MFTARSAARLPPPRPYRRPVPARADLPHRRRRPCHAGRQGPGLELGAPRRLQPRLGRGRRRLVDRERIAFDGSAPTQPDPYTFLMPGGDVYPRTPVTRDLAEAARDLAARSGRVASVRSGAFVLGATGLLDGTRATTHWKIADRLAALHPRARVEPDAIYVRDGTVCTSAGVTAGIDLALALVEEDHGPDLAREVARSLVVYLQRAASRSSPLPCKARRPGRPPCAGSLTWSRCGPLATTPSPNWPRV